MISSLFLLLFSGPAQQVERRTANSGRPGFGAPFTERQGAEAQFRPVVNEVARTIIHSMPRRNLQAAALRR